MSERLTYWLYGAALGAALTAAIGRPLVAERGAKIIPLLCAVGLGVMLLCGWALDGYIAYVHTSSEMH